MGIADFRLDIDPASRAEERKKLEVIARRYRESSTFKELMSGHVRQNTKPELVELELDYELRWGERGKEVEERIETLLRRAGRQQNHETYLDVGCGKGAMLGTLASRYGSVVGLDYTLRYLVFAKKLLEEIGATNVQVVCGSAENLPFAEGAFDAISALDVIEHIPDQERGLQEMSRVLSPSGFLYLNSPNRFNIFTPEDHVRIWGVGFVPRKFMQSYINLFSNHSYGGVRLLSLFELRSYLTKLGGTFVIEGLMLGNRTGDSLLRRMLAKNGFIIWLANRLMKALVPSHNALYWNGTNGSFRPGAGGVVGK